VSAPQTALEDVQGDAEVGVGVAQDGEGAENVGLDAQFLAEFAPETCLGGLARLDLAAGELPEAAEKAFGLAAVNEDSAGVADDADGAFDVRQGFAARGARQAALLAARAGGAAAAQRTGRAEGIARQADCGAEFHQRLVEVPRAPGRQPGAGDAPKTFGQGRCLRVAPKALQTAEDARHVPIHDRFPASEGDAGDGAGGVTPDARQAAQGFGRIGQSSAVFTEDLGRRAAQVAGAGVVAKSLPGLEHARLRRGGQGREGGEEAHPAFVVGNDRGHLGLLKHDLGDPDGVGVAGAPPRQIAPPAAIPRQQGAGDGVVGRYLRPPFLRQCRARSHRDSPAECGNGPFVHG